MLRPSATTSRALARAIGLRATSSFLGRQPQILLTRRFLADKRNSTPSKANNTKASSKDPTPPVLPGGASAAAPDAPPKLVQSVDAPGSSISPPASKTAPIQVPFTPHIPGTDVRPPIPDPSLKLETPLKTESPLPGVPSKGTNPPLPSGPWPTVKVNSIPDTPITSTIPSPPQIPPKDIITSTPPPNPPNPPQSVPEPPKRRRRLQRFLILFTLLTGTAFAGGVYYSLRSDNFHDFFTEYVPFGEEAVLYFEEKEFRRRFPNALSRVLHKKGESKVTIPQKSGATWRIVEDDKPKFTELNKDGPHLKSIVRGEDPKPQEKSKSEKELKPNEKQPDAIIPMEPVQAKIVEEKPLPPPKASERVDAAKQSTERATTTIPPPHLPSPPPAATMQQQQPTLDYVEIHKDSDPIVADLAKIINSIINLANTSKTPNIFEPVIDSAKTELEQINARVIASKEEEWKAVVYKLQKKRKGLMSDMRNSLSTYKMNLHNNIGISFTQN